MASARLLRLSAPLGSGVVANAGTAVQRMAIPCAMRRIKSMLGPRQTLVEVAGSHGRNILPYAGIALHHHSVQCRLGGKMHLLQRPIAPFFQCECCHDRGLLPMRRGYCVQSLPSRLLPLDRPRACSVPTLHPAWGPPTMVG